MSFSRQWYEETKQRLESKLRKTTVGKENLTEEPADAAPLGEEIKALHEPFIQWMNLHQILYVHANPTKKSTVQKGQADFICLRCGAGCAVEFKALADPESGLSQEQRDWRDWAQRCEVPCIVTNSLSEAKKFVTRELELSL